MKLYLIRHGESKANAGTIHQGHLDSPLSELGELQARKVAERFKEINDFEVIYSSDLQRAHNTAKEIQKYHPEVKLITDRRLREKDHGDFTGKEKKEKLYDTLAGQDIHEKVPPNGESMHDLQDRVNELLLEIIAKNKSAIMVSHGGTTRAIIRELTKAPFKIFSTQPVDNTGVFEIEITDNQIKVIRENCVRHLFE